MKNHHVCKKKFLKNQNFGQKSKYLLKIKMFVKNQNFCKNSKFHEKSLCL